MRALVYGDWTTPQMSGLEGPVERERHPACATVQLFQGQEQHGTARPIIDAAGHPGAWRPGGCVLIESSDSDFTRLATHGSGVRPVRDGVGEKKIPEPS